jgi:cytoskeleton protein RodZ
MGGLDEMDQQGSIGQTLRQRREERGLTVEQAAYQSKVPLRLVQALESDDYHLLPDALYLIRLLHEYAAFLQLDVSALDDEFRRAVRRPPYPPLVPPAPARTVVIPWKQALWTVAAILVVTPLVFIALSLASKRTQERAAQAPVAEPRAEESRQAAEEASGIPNRLLGSVAPSTAHSPDLAAGQGPATTVRKDGDMAALAVDVGAETGPARHILIVRAQESTWLSIRSDRGERRQVLLQPGQAARFGAETMFRVTVGNAGGVSLWLDGAPFPLQGRSGEVIRDLALPPPRGGLSAVKAASESSQQ